jgi:hypothetical protein
VLPRIDHGAVFFALGINQGAGDAALTQVDGFIWFIFFLSLCVAGFEVSVNSDE